MVRPSDLASKLRHIASKIDASQRPSRELVARDLHRVLAAIGDAGDTNKFVIVHVGGDESFLFFEDTDIRPPDGRFMKISIPNSDDLLFVARADLLKDSEFVASIIPEHLQSELVTDPPSVVASRLRSIAPKIEASNLPSRELVAQDLRRVLAGMEDAVVGYRVIMDEPVGITVGFKPEGVEADELQIVEDDGGEFVLLDPEAGEARIVSEHSDDAEPDLLVWRSPEEFEAWKAEMAP